MDKPSYFPDTEDSVLEYFIHNNVRLIEDGTEVADHALIARISTAVSTKRIADALERIEELLRKRTA